MCIVALKWFTKYTEKQITQLLNNLTFLRSFQQVHRETNNIILKNLTFMGSLQQVHIKTNDKNIE